VTLPVFDQVEGSALEGFTIARNKIIDIGHLMPPHE
jgi:hypothetical protein